jgi:preprotein translocase subunit SecA
MLQFLKGLFDYNKKEVARLSKIVENINSFESDIAKLSDTRLKAKTKEFKKRLKSSEDINNILPEAFAVVREATKRTIGQRHFDVQLMAGVALFEGKIAEQKTGEGKTLTATCPLYLRALQGKGAHLVTVNDYLARIGAGWMGEIYNFLGVSVGCIIPDNSFIFDPDHKEKADDERLEHLKPVTRDQAYKADITYGTNNEFGFDYLRDNMVYEFDKKVQRGHFYAIVDEIDFALIDEARTPLIISSPSGDSVDKYYRFTQLAGDLQPDMDYVIDEKAKTAMLTELGIRKIERSLKIKNLYEEDFDTIHHIENALKARTLFHKDTDYVIKDGQVVIVDEFTGRLMEGRRWSDGLHQAVEAKEGVKIQQESRTWATITFQNYFRLYENLAGMTGTAATEAEEFKKIYNLDVIVFPTNKPIRRIDLPDLVYKSQQAKYAALAAEIEKVHKKGSPILIGTTSIEKNEIVGRLLSKKRIPHEILNAKNHLREAKIISQAGALGAVTVATNMAGRGVDIVLGGQNPSKDERNYEQKQKEWKKNHDKVVELGGLYVYGTEKHEARRIDNQLRGRSGRQGDPGLTQFFVSLEDDLMRVFGGDQIANMMGRMNIPDNMPISHSMVTKVLEQIQVKVEGFNFDIRKSLVEFDDVVNRQREVVYSKRDNYLQWFASEPMKIKQETERIMEKEAKNTVSMSIDPITLAPDKEKIMLALAEILAVENADQRDEISQRLNKLSSVEKLESESWKIVKEKLEQREEEFEEKVLRDIEKSILLFTLDNLWVDHLTALENLKDGVRLRGYGQRDPLVEYRKESFDMFQALLDKIDFHFSRRLFRVQVVQSSMQRSARVEEGRGEIDLPSQQEVVRENGGVLQNPEPIAKSRPVVSGQIKIGRNDPCWCGSGKKWKKCHYPEMPS